MKIKFFDKNTEIQASATVTLTQNKEISCPHLNETDLKNLNQSLEREGFEATHGQITSVSYLNQGTVHHQVIVGITPDLNLANTLKLGGGIYDFLQQHKFKNIIVRAPKGPTIEHLVNIAQGFELKSYQFLKYITKNKEKKQPQINTVSFFSTDANKAQKLWDDRRLETQGVFLTRDLVSEPANHLQPKDFVAQAQNLAQYGLQVNVLTQEKMKELGMGALLGVGQGAQADSFLVTLSWKGGKETDAPLAVVGKGVCFDAGGISLKRPQGMEDMKFDMGGAGVVTGLMKTLALRKAKANVIGVIGLVENMPDGNAQRPGDIVTSLSGQTIEVINTDAEGRLVLADAFTYVQQTYKPHTLIDLATLTGAVIVSLGGEYAGLLSNNDDLANQLLESGVETEEKFWRLPLHTAYDKGLDSPIADMRNISSDGKAGTIVAGQFLQRFINDDVRWAHLDIAGTVWSAKDGDLSVKGATGFGVRVLNHLIKTHYED